MKKAATILIMAALLVLGGHSELFARKLPACLNPESAEYNQPAIGGICGKCGNIFTFSGYQLEHNRRAACPYCGHKQDLKDACNRYSKVLLSED